MKKAWKKVSVGWLIGAVVCLLAAVYVVVMFAVNRPHDAAFDSVLLCILLFLPAGGMALLAFRPEKLRFLVALIILGICVALAVLSMTLLPDNIAAKFLTDPNRYADARNAVEFWAYSQDDFSGSDLTRVMPQFLPAGAKNVTLFLCLPYGEQPLSLEVTFTLDESRYESFVKTIDGYPTSVPEEGDYEIIYIAYEAQTVIGDRCVYYYCNDDAHEVKLFVYDGNAAYVG